MRATVLALAACLLPAMGGAQTATPPVKAAPSSTAPATTAPASATPAKAAPPAATAPPATTASASSSQGVTAPKPAPAAPTSPVPVAGSPAGAGSGAAGAPASTAAAVLASPGFPYKPEGRRDPFVSLMRRGSGVAAASRSGRPAGLAGLDIAETTLKGTLASEGGLVAMLLGADQRTYIVRTGERLNDGVIRSITKDAVVFLQKVDDPLSREKQREVRKVLRQTEEAK
jgi:Tfp pilus assembly protein PilP